MAEIKAFPLNLQQYVGADWPMLWHYGRTSGVFAANNNLLVAASGVGLGVTVTDGAAWLGDQDGHGIVMKNATYADTGALLSLTCDTADGVLNRIDAVIAEWYLPNYATLPTIRILKGTPASTAAAPSLTNNGTYRQIALAAVSVAAGTLALDSTDITDTRLNETLCGLVSDSVTIPTDGIDAQAQLYLEQLRGAIAEAASGAAPNGFYSYTCTTTGTVHALTKASHAGANILFTADAAFADGDTFTVDGVAVTAQTQDGEALADGYFASGAVVSCFLSGTTLNFKAGGAARLRLVGGTTAPASAAEYTVWVNTSVAVGAVTWASTAPAAPAAGDVWVQLGTGSTAPIPLTAAQTAWIYPERVQQYIGGTWVQKQAQELVGGAWVMLGDYLYYYGNLYSEKTGGWGVGNNASFGTVTNTSGGLVATKGSTYVEYCSVRTIDLTDANTLTCNIATSGTGSLIRMDVMSDRGHTQIVAMTTVTARNTEDAIVNVDVSSLSGAYYIGCIGDVASVTMHSLERK